MAYKVVVTFSDGEIMDSEEVEGPDGVFDNEEDAEDWFDRMLSDYRAGNEVLHMSNPGDYPLDDETPEYEIVEI